MSATLEMNSAQIANENPEVAIGARIEKIFYGDFLAVRDADVDIEKGKITGFIGPSGCGKSPCSAR